MTGTSQPPAADSGTKLGILIVVAILVIALWLAIVTAVGVLFIASVVVFGGNTGHGDSLLDGFGGQIVAGFTVLGLAGIPAGLAICVGRFRGILLAVAGVLIAVSVVVIGLVFQS